jgi:hypothetical protein
VPNPGFEATAAGGAPVDWSFRLTSPACTAAAVQDGPQAGGRCLRLRAVASPGNAGKPPWLRHVAASSRYITSVVPGQAYHCAVRLRADEPDTRVRLEALSYRGGAYDVRFSNEAAVGTEWRQLGVTFRFPRPGDGNYHEGMTGTFYVRITLSRDEGTLWIDDAELRAASVLDEWEAWQAEGWDRNSIVADPLFVDLDQGDYRLRPESPARQLGFDPIPVGETGCYPDALRASWPINDSDAEDGGH